MITLLRVMNQFPCLSLFAIVCCLAFVGCSNATIINEAPQDLKPGQVILKPTTTKVASRVFNADEGFAIVAENPADSLSRRISIPVLRIRSANPNAREPIFWLNGGPGTSNMRYRSIVELFENHDVVLVGYRGVDGSTVLSSDEVKRATKASTMICSAANPSSTLVT